MLDVKQYPALVVNEAFRPVAVWEWPDALDVVMRRQRAYVVTEYDVRVRSASLSFALPSVVALKPMRRGPSLDRPAAFTRRSVFLAYAQRSARGLTWRCGLCGEDEPDTEELTFEHIVPRSRGGTTCWGNICLAHQSCNNRKGNRTMTEAGLSLKVRLLRPTETDIMVSRIRSGFAVPPAAWRDFLGRDYWDVPLDR